MVRRIFTLFAAGQSPRSIGKSLNEESIPGAGRQTMVGHNHTGPRHPGARGSSETSSIGANWSGTSSTMSKIPTPANDLPGSTRQANGSGTTSPTYGSSTMGYGALFRTAWTAFVPQPWSRKPLRNGFGRSAGAKHLLTGLAKMRQMWRIPDDRGRRLSGLQQGQAARNLLQQTGHPSASPRRPGPYRAQGQSHETGDG